MVFAIPGAAPPGRYRVRVQGPRAKSRVQKGATKTLRRAPRSAAGRGELVFRQLQVFTGDLAGDFVLDPDPGAEKRPF